LRNTNAYANSDSYTDCHAYSDTYADCDTDSYTHANADSHSYGNSDCASAVANPNGHAQTYADAEAAADAASAGLIGTLKAGTRERNLASSHAGGVFAGSPPQAALL
jgi:hypothetical protein